jgi:hypothetical protein
VHDDPRDAAVRATARRCTLSLKQRITSRTRYAKKITEAYHSRRVRGETTDARSCIVVDVVAIRNSFGFVDRRHPVSGASKVPRVGTAGGATSPCGIHYFSLRDH